MFASFRNRLLRCADLRGGVGRRLASGFGAQGATFVVLILLQFFAVPVCLSAWGATVYGDWLVLTAAAGLLIIADFGMHGHLCNGLRAAWARGERDAGQRILQAGLGVYALSSAGLLIVAALALTAFDPTALGIEGLDREQATIILAAGAASTILSLPRELTLTVYAAREQFHRQVADFLLLTALQQGTVIACAAAGLGPVAAAAGQLIVGLTVGWGVSLFLLRRRHPDVAFAPRLPTRAELRALAAKSPFYAVQQGGGVLLVQLPVVMLGRLSSAEAVVTFSALRTLTGLCRQGVNQFTTVAGLEIAGRHARGDLAGAAALYRVAASLAGAVAGVAGAAVLTLGPAFFDVWTRGAIVFDMPTAATFVAATFLMTPAYTAFGALRLIDRPQPLAAALSAQAVLTAALGWALIPGGGAVGAAVAVGAAEVVAAGPIMIAAAAAAFSCPAASIPLRAYAVGAAAAVAVGGACLAGAAGFRFLVAAV